MSPMTNKTKTFDCVRFKHQAQARFYEATRGMSAEQRREYLLRTIESGALADFWAKVTRQVKTAPKAGRL